LPGGSGSGGSGSGAGGGAPSKFCTDAAALFQEFAQGGNESDMATMIPKAAKAFTALAKIAPAEIKGDVDKVANAFASGALMNPSAFGADMSASMTRVTTYIGEHCGSLGTSG
jgi:hypothetical protein